MKRFRLLSMVLAATASFSAVAQDDTAAAASTEFVRDVDHAAPAIANRPYISLMGTHLWEDRHRGIDPGYGGTLAIGKQFGNKVMLELTGFYLPMHVASHEPTAKLAGYGLGAMVFPIDRFTDLYAKVAAYYGDVKDHPYDNGDGRDNYTSIVGDVGFGYLFGPFEWLNRGALRLEGVVRGDFHDEKHAGEGGHSEFYDEVVNFGFLIPIGASPEKAVPAEPAPVEVVPVTPPADSDGDGVTDDLDQCPGTPAGTAVDEKGCPLPPPAKAECKTPEPGQPVTLEGCAAGDVIVLRGVNFEFNKSTLTTNAKTILDGVADALTAAPNVNVELGGHTDSKGSDEYNQKLSERRAASVVSYLTSKGIAASRMTSKGYGETMPVADNNTDEGRELNRRVELKIAGDSGAGAVTAAPAAPAAPAADAAPPPADAAPPPG